MGAPKTDPKKAAAIIAMSEGGYGPSGISRQLEVPLGTVNDIIHGRNGWDRIHSQPWFRDYVTRYHTVLRASLTEIAKKAFIRVDETVSEATPGQAMWIGAVAIDKMEKLDGHEMGIPEEPLTKEKWDKLNKTFVMLMEEINRRKAKEQAIEVEKVAGGNGSTGTT